MGAGLRATGRVKHDGLRGRATSLKANPFKPPNWMPERSHQIFRMARNFYLAADPLLRFSN